MDIYIFKDRRAEPKYQPTVRIERSVELEKSAPQYSPRIFSEELPTRRVNAAIAGAKKPPPLTGGAVLQ